MLYELWDRGSRISEQKKSGDLEGKTLVKKAKISRSIREHFLPRHEAEATNPVIGRNINDILPLGYGRVDELCRIVWLRRPELEAASKYPENNGEFRVSCRVRGPLNIEVQTVLAKGWCCRVRGVCVLLRLAKEGVEVTADYFARRCASNKLDFTGWGAFRRRLLVGGSANRIPVKESTFWAVAPMTSDPPGRLTVGALKDKGRKHNQRMWWRDVISYD